MYTVKAAFEEALVSIDRVDAQVLMAHVLAVNRAWIAANPMHVLTESQDARIDMLVAQRALGQPVAYLVGKREFYARDFEVGPEVLTGSSRLKSGTAQKMICNMLTTGAMARLGYVSSNLMVNLILKNHKLVERGIVIIQTLARVDQKTAEETLKQARMSLPVALVMLKANVSRTEAVRRLKKNKGNVRKAIGGRHA